jgi:DNA polymerase eta
MLASKNTRPAVTSPEQGMHWLRILSGELLVRLKEARELSPSLWPRTLVIGHRTGIESAKHRQAPFPFSRNLDAEYILRHAKRLWEEVCQPMSKGGMKLNNVRIEQRIPRRADA